MDFGIVNKIKKALVKEPEKKLKYDLQEVSKLYELATMDIKTNLFNFRHFETESKQEIAIAQRYKRAISLILVDIDDFKAINDRYGYKMGDEMLKKVAAIIKENARDTDIAARFGGEEFTILLPETTAEQAKQLAERLREKVLQDSLLKAYRLSISIGIGYDSNGHDDIYKKKDESKEKFINVNRFYDQFMPKKDYGDTKLDLFDQANVALKYAKKHGKNQSVVFHHSMSFGNAHNRIDLTKFKN